MAKRTDKAVRTGAAKWASGRAIDLTTRAGVQPILDASAAARAKMDHSPEAARVRLRKLGILTAGGKLTKRYATPKP